MQNQLKIWSFDKIVVPPEKKIIHLIYTPILFYCFKLLLFFNEDIVSVKQ